MNSGFGLEDILRMRRTRFSNIWEGKPIKLNSFLQILTEHESFVENAVYCSKEETKERFKARG